MSADTPGGQPPDDTNTNFNAAWSSDGLTRSFSPSATGTGLPADMPFLFAQGQRFGPYLIVRPLGKGGMGQVYEAEETDSGRRIAIKILSRGLGDDEERERFLREGQLAASLSHPNTVYVFGTTEVQGFPVIAMELAPGGTLKDLLVEGTPLPFATAVDAILQVVAGLEAAASIGILHRDVKPSNCFVHRDGRVLVGDFGLSVATTSRGGGSTPGAILGTPGFASPEQLRGEALDVRSDIYAVGATIFYLLSGRAPFDDKSTTALINRVAAEPPPSLLTLRPDVPRRLALVVARCLAKKPDDRYPGYHALTSALKPFSSARLKPAPIVRRMLAGWIDLGVVAWPIIPLRRSFGLVSLSPGHPGDAAFVALAAIGVMTAYFGILEGRVGATPGKALAGLRVIDAENEPPGISKAVLRALVFSLPLQLIARLAAFLALGRQPEISVALVASVAGMVSLAVLFATARRSNGYVGLHDRATATRVVLRRRLTESRQRHDRVAGEATPPPAGAERIGPYLVPVDTARRVSTAMSIEGHDDRLGRRVWIELLPPGTPPLNPIRRDLGRSGRPRWLAGRRNGDECWDAYEAIEGEPIEAAGAQPQPWFRVRHWLADLADELVVGLDAGSLPALHNRRVWIDRDDRGRLIDWSAPGSGAPSFDPDAVAPDLRSAQQLLYGVAAGALLGIPPASAREGKPDTPLPMQARRLLLSLREGALPSTAAIAEQVAAVVHGPAVYPKGRRAVQIGVSVLLPIVTTIATIAAMLFASSQKGAVRLTPSATMWTAGLAVAAIGLLSTVPFALFSAFVARGGVTLRAFGAAVVNRRGEPASRLRTLWRAVVTWCPAAVLSVLILIFKDGWASATADPRAVILPSAGLALLVAGAAWTAYHPSRSVQDRIARTWIVPR